MRPTEKIEKFIRKFEVDINTKKDHVVLDELLEAQAKSANPNPNIWRIIMKTKIAKLATAVIIIIAVLFGINQFSSSTNEIEVAELIHGPQTYSFNDGSTVKLAEGAEIELYGNIEKRGFEHLAGEIEVRVAKGKSEFIVVTSFGNIKALGTVFKVEMVDEDSTEMLAVKVKKGAVEVSNPQGMVVLKENETATVERNQGPYDFRQDGNLPPRLVERIQLMLEAIETGDKRAWLANFNLKAMFDLVKGKIKFDEHRDWFSGMSEDDAMRLIKGFADVNSIEEMIVRVLPGISDMADKIYVRSVILAEDGKHAKANCFRYNKERSGGVGYTPQWTFFNGDWWQTDD